MVRPTVLIVNDHEARVTQIFLKPRLDGHPDSHRRVLAVLTFLGA